MARRITHIKKSASLALALGVFIGWAAFFNPPWSQPVAAAFALCTTPNFLPARSLYAGPGAHGIAIGDLDGDGKPDLAVANYHSNYVSILKGDGTGNFVLGAGLIVGSNPYEVIISDLNGDGKADLAVTNSRSDNISILMGNGAGGFSSPTNYPVGDEPYFIAASDFNGDGKLDLAVSNIFSNSVSILLNNGAGGFGTASHFPVGAHPHGFAVSDFNMDGKPDLAVANQFSGDTSILLNNGVGSFSSAPAVITYQSSPIDAGAGDFNGDGKIDLVITHNLGPATIHFGNGNGTFNLSPNLYTVGNYPVSVAVTDFNSDCKLDFAIVNAGASVTVYFGNGTGGFGARTDYGVGTEPRLIAVGDINNDNSPDLAVTSTIFNVATVLLNACPSAPASPPTTTADLVGDTDNNVWYRSDVNVLLNATDTGCPLGVKEITYSATGAQTITGTTVSGDSAAFLVTAEGETQVTFFAKDNVGSTEIAQTITIRIDKTAPVLTVPADVVIEATGPAGASVTWTEPMAQDNLDPNPNLICTHSSGGVFAIGVTTVTCLAADAAGNRTTRDFSVTVRDSTAPALTLPADITVAATSPLGAVVSYSVSANDLVDGAVSVSCSPLSGSTFPIGTTSVTCTASDRAGNIATGGFKVKVQNAPPTAQAGGPYAVAEGAAVAVTALGSDPEGGPLTFAWDLNNDGSFETSGQSVTFSAAGLDGPSSRTISVRVTDNIGLSATAQATVNVQNVAPSVGMITAPVSPVQVNAAVSASANFADPGTLDTHTAVWEWGDGATSAGLLNEMNGSGSVNGSHSYASAGVYTIKLTVTDKDGEAGQSIFQYIVIYDPVGGFVTGGGWIDSPSGAYPASLSLMGRANFGFVSKYQPGAATPTGNTEFQFRVANFNFRSASYDWLVVAGAKAQFKGTGTINGTGNYGFMLTAVDGQLNGGGGVDKFRIKIWDKSNGDAIVYDNQMGAGDNDSLSTALGGGSIVIHK